MSLCKNLGDGVSLPVVFEEIDAIVMELASKECVSEENLGDNVIWVLRHLQI